MSKKVLHYIPGFDYGGIETCFVNWNNNIDRNSIELILLIQTDANNKYIKDFIGDGGKLFKISKIFNFTKFMKELNELFKKNKFDIIHCHSSSSGLFLLLFAKIYGVKKRILHSHTTQDDNGRYYVQKKLFRKLSKYLATDYLACSKEAGEWLFGKKTTKEIEIIHNAINIEEYLINENTRNKYREQFNIKQKFVVGHVGRFCYAKNQEFVIDIFKEVIDLNKDSILLLVGDGSSRSHLEKKIIELGLNEKVIFTGVSSDISGLLNAMDVFILPSRYEGLGIAAIEAQAAGLRCFVSDQVPDEVCITNLAEKISLLENSNVWAENIVGYNNAYIRRDTSNEIKNSGYDIIDSVKKLEKIYNV